MVVPSRAISGLFRSTDNGANWTAATTPPDGVGRGLAADGSGNWVAVGSDLTGAWRSVDTGDTWINAATSITGNGNCVAAQRLLP